MTQSLNFDATQLPSPHLGPSHEAWRKTVRAFVNKEIRPHIEEWEEAGAFPRTLHHKAAQIGLLGLGFPEEYGGLLDDTDIFHSLIASQELAQAGSGGLIAGLMTHGIGLPPIIALGTDELKRRVAPAILSGEKLIALCVTEPSGGSDVANLQTQAIRQGNNYIVNGEKTFITTGMRADYLTVAVRTGGNDPQHKGARGLSFLLIEADQPSISRTRLKKMGWWISDTASIHFDNVKVPVRNLIGPENSGFAGIVANFNMERLTMAAPTIGRT